MRAAILLLLLLCASACASTPPSSSARKTPAPAAPETPAAPAFAPRPFTADQIRDAMPAGTEIRFRLEEAGKPAVIMHWKVTAADAASMTLVTRILGEDGSLIAEEPAGTSRWDQLVEHASFPADLTVKSEGSVEVPAGTFDSIDYVVTETVDGSRTVSTFKFARQLPGPPVLLSVDKDGVMVRRMTLVERTPRPSAP